MHLVSPHKGIAFWLGTQVVESVTARQALVIPGVPNPPPLGHLGFSFWETRFGGFFFASAFYRDKKNRRRTPVLLSLGPSASTPAEGASGATLPGALEPQLKHVIRRFRQGQ